MKRKDVEESEASTILSKKGRFHDPSSTSFVDYNCNIQKEDDRKDDDDDDDDVSEKGTQYADTATSLPGQTPLTPLSPARKWPSDLKTLQCPHADCTKTFNRPARLAAHLRSHNNDRPFKCPHENCDKDYIEEKHLRQHIKGSHTTERDHVCAQPGCGKSFMTATRLRRHQAVHEGEERFRCRDYPPCNQTFRKHQTLQRHIRSEHLHQAAYICNHKDSATGLVCGAGFDSPGPLRRHQEREHGENRFWCDECASQQDPDGNAKRVGFPTLALLQSHMKQAHVNCMFCGLMCCGRADLEQHIESQHAKPPSNNEQPPKTAVACTWPGCTKSFSRVANMNAHIRSFHEGVRFVCGQVDLSRTEDLAAWPRSSQGCGEGFTTKAGLENHVRYVHLKHERPAGQTSAYHQAAAPSRPELIKNPLEELAGVGDRSRQTLPCTFPDCSIKFAHNGELESHIRAEHSVEKALLDSIGGEAAGADHILPPPPSAEPVPPLAYGEHDLPDMADWEADYGGGEFWVGAGAGTPGARPGDGDEEWLHDEAEMRRLVGYDNPPSYDLHGLLDPQLEL
ncbi:hypothetical protein F5X96DRAFT_414747 [Biscogniauxia mediterranea]|nr:hypothetical protein F5X96DRAFT_414747 [Biscogniauxia mediterranea]